MSFFREELANGASTGSPTEGVPIPTATMLQAEVRITGGSGTVSAYDQWLESSSDKINWFPMVADYAIKKVNDGTGGTVRTNVRDIVDAKNNTTAEDFVAVYRHVPGKYVRSNEIIAGTTPSLTRQIVICGK